MSKRAVLFPGQGSQFAGMGKSLAESYPSAKAIFEQADDALGFSISKLCFEGPEEELKKSNERFDYAVRATFDAIWDWDIVNNSCYWGDGFEQLFGYDVKQLNKTNPNFSDNIHLDDIEYINTQLNQLLAGELNSWNEEFRYKKANGEYADVQDRGIVIRNTDGKAIRMIGAMQDITSKKAEAEKLNQLNQMLEKQAENLTASNNELERFAYVASHDLQEPLRMVTSFLNLLEKKYKSQIDETAEKYIHFAVDGAERMKNLIHDLLEYSRVSTTKDLSGITNMKEIIQQIKEIFLLRIKETGALLQTGSLPTLCNTNPILILQLMQNLVGNALKYIGKEQPEIMIDVEELAGYWQFSVKDNGIGINPVYSEKIFLIFQRLHSKDQYEGTGIGLSICKKIVEIHEGRIWVESTLGHGSTFYFTLKK